MNEPGEITRCYSLRYERRSRHSPERLWRAIMDPGELSRWMSYPARVDLRVGGDYSVDFSRTSEGTLEGVIVRIEPARRLAVGWHLWLDDFEAHLSGALPTLDSSRRRSRELAKTYRVRLDEVLGAPA